MVFVAKRNLVFSSHFCKANINFRSNWNIFVPSLKVRDFAGMVENCPHTVYHAHTGSI